MELFLVLLNIVFIEAILSIDNASVLAVMVKKLPEHQQGKALRYGIIGAYAFRALSLLFVSVLIDIWWIKPIGWLYLIYLMYDFFTSVRDQHETLEEKEEHRIMKHIKWLSPFWRIVLAVEFVDLMFSLDNLVAVVALSDKLRIIIFGVFIGILAMRFVAQYFISLLKKYPALETSAFLVIGILWAKLCASGIAHFYPDTWRVKVVESHSADLLLSALNLLIFFTPIIYAWAKKRRKVY